MKIWLLGVFGTFLAGIITFLPGFGFFSRIKGGVLVSISFIRLARPRIGPISSVIRVLFLRGR